MGCLVGKRSSIDSREDPATMASGQQRANSATMSSLPSFPAPNSAQRAGSKVSLKQGRSLMDWIRLTNSGKDLQGFGGRFQKVSLDELAKHDKEDDAWLCIRGHVYNITDYLEYHPGGVPEIMKGAGIDATQLFNEVHQWVNAESMLQKCLIGPLVKNVAKDRKKNSGLVSPPTLSLLPPPTGPAPFKPKQVTEDVFWKCTVSSVDDVTHNVKLFCFRLPDGIATSAPLGHHVYLKRTISGMEITRAYTVVVPSLVRHAGDPGEENNNKHLYLMIKIYENGALTPSLQNICIGDQCLLNCYGGNFQVSRLKDAKDVCMIAGGTGFTPMIRIIHLFVQNKLPCVRTVKMFFANREESDIIWKSQLDEISEKHGERFKVFYFLSDPPQYWTAYTGRVSESVLRQTMPACPASGEEKDVLICVCGPDAFTHEQIRNVKNIGFQDASIHAFLS